MKNILLVDDEKQILQSLAEGLYCYGYDWNVLTAENGKQGAAIVDTACHRRGGDGPAHAR